MGERKRYMQSAAVFMILRKDTQILLLQRQFTGWMDGHFSFPAGALEAGETVKSAAIREALEEVGVTVRPQDATFAHMMHCKTGSSAWTGYFFTSVKWVGEPRVCESDKHADILWCESTMLPDNLIPYVRQAVEMIDRGEAYSEFGWEN